MGYRFRSKQFPSTQVSAWFPAIARTRVGRLATFSPSDLSPQLWLDASDTSTIIESGGAVSQWNNKGSLGNFTQGVAASQPTTGVSTFNGKNVVDFAADFLVSADAAASWKFLHDGTIWFMVSVLQNGVVADPNAVYIFMGTNNTGSASTGMSLWLDDRSTGGGNERARMHVSNNTANLSVNAETANGFISTNTAKILSAIVDPGNATAADRSVMRVNKGADSKTNTVTATPSTSNPSNTMRVGAAGNSAFPLTGKIAELVIVSGANATVENRTKVEDYMASKWGISV